MTTRNLPLINWISALTKLSSARKSQKTTSDVLKNSIHFLPLLILVSVTIISLAPFAAKAFNIDEPLFIWVAKHIQLHPLDFYGFRINWYGAEMDAARIIKNPPLASYFIALTAYISGWNEIPLHLAFLLPAIAAATGTYFLAREFTRHPLSATLIGILNPVFILSGTTVMCDVMMLAFYVWAVFFWVRGIKDDRCRDLFIAAVLITLCCLTKYFGLSLLPLLFLYTLMAGEGRRQRALFLLIPIAVLCLYQWETYLIYGRGLLSDAASYASKEKALNLAAIFPNLVTGLSFTGGGLISILFFVPQLWNRRTVLAAAILVLPAAFGLSRLSFSHLPETPWWGYYLQLSVFAAAGINILVLAGRDLWQRKEPGAMFLVLWILGTFVFAAVINWSVNGRSILPMAPAAGIVVMRFLENKNGQDWQPGVKQMLLPLSCAWLVCMMVTWADFSLAETARTAAQEIGRTYGSSAKPLWFQGHWGFQYYMEKNGGTAYDRKKTSIQPGDIMVMPENNTNAFPEIMAQGTPLQVLQFTPARFLTTMNFSAGAGYYSSGFGPIPFLVDKAPEERYHVVVFPPSHQP
jgi:4-amino-4-deoxy-L-arabinose transferase-like glycosyltransferase